MLLWRAGLKTRKPDISHMNGQCGAAINMLVALYWRGHQAVWTLAVVRTDAVLARTAESAFGLARVLDGGMRS
jgi:hypothetical protein